MRSKPVMRKMPPSKGKLVRNGFHHSINSSNVGDIAGTAVVVVVVVAAAADVVTDDVVADVVTDDVGVADVVDDVGVDVNVNAFCLRVRLPLLPFFLLLLVLCIVNF